MPRRSSDNPDLYKFGEGTLSTSQMNPKDVRHAQNQTDGTNAATTASSAFPTAHLKACPKGQNARSYDQVTPDLTGDKLSAEKPVQESASCESLASPRDQAHVTDQDPEAGACSADGGCDERDLDEQAVRSGDRAISDNSTATEKSQKGRGKQMQKIEATRGQEEVEVNCLFLTKLSLQT
ncbi:hypothetical protein BaRGS_00013774 [Batillaria attramentaria]|uniref:Uncharacterized protein n=1 Tax=Batillaria attramentaria TaxID=370345 RepID=A0ABD0L688_9CAEN